jgi:hypothetical protein
VLIANLRVERIEWSGALSLKGLEYLVWAVECGLSGRLAADRGFLSSESPSGFGRLWVDGVAGELAGWISVASSGGVAVATTRGLGCRKPVRQHCQGCAC